MQYQLTTYSDVTNAGANKTVNTFDTFYELQDYIEEQTAGMSDDDRELYMSYSNIDVI